MALLATLPGTAGAAIVYWDGTGTDWGTASFWSTSAGAATPDPSSFPGASDVATFSISTVNTAQTVNLNADRSVQGLSFLGTNSATTALIGGGTNRTLMTGSSGVTVAAGAGAVTIGSATAGQNVSIELNGSQTWANNASSLLTIANAVSRAGPNNTSYTLTVNGSGAGGTKFDGAISDGPGQREVALVVDTTGGKTTFAGANTFSGTTTISRGTLEVAVGGSLSGTTGINVSSAAVFVISNTANDVLNASAPIGMAGGVLQVANSVSGNTQTLGALSVSALSTVDFGTGSNGTTDGNTLRFSSLSLGGSNLKVDHWSGTPYALGVTTDTNTDVTQDRLLVTADPGFTLGTLIPSISFYGDNGLFLGYGMAVSFSGGGFEIVATVPEPLSVAFLGPCLIGICLMRVRPKHRRRFARQT